MIVTPVPRHDLHALACCLFQLVEPAAFEAIRTERSIRRIHRFWSAQFERPLWAAVLICVERLDYETLKRFARVLLPSFVAPAQGPLTHATAEEDDFSLASLTPPSPVTPSSSLNSTPIASSSFSRSADQLYQCMKHLDDPAPDSTPAAITSTPLRSAEKASVF